MKKQAIAIVVSLALSSPLVLAASHGAANTQSGMGSQMMQQGGSGMAQMPMMRQMQQMQEQMGLIHNTDDPKQRRKLLEEHIESMQGMMQMMHGMMGSQGGMMGPRGMGQGAMQGQGPGMMGGQGSMTGPGATNMPDMSGQFGQRMDMMQERMNTMQMLMDQMMQNQSEILNSMPGMGAEQ